MKLKINNYNFNYSLFFLINNYIKFLDRTINYFFFRTIFLYFSEKFYFILKNKILIQNLYILTQDLFLRFERYFVKFIYFNWFKFFIFIGAGYKNKLNWKLNYLFLYCGYRHWITFRLTNKIKNIFITKRKSLVLISFSKNLLFTFFSNIKKIRLENFFKLKGVLDVRSKRRWLFIRKIKIKGLKIKLSKKQNII